MWLCAAFPLVVGWQYAGFSLVVGSLYAGLMPSGVIAPSPSVTPRRLLVGLGLVVLCAAPFLQLHMLVRYGQQRIPGPRPADSDLYAPWLGVRAALHHQNPYSPAITQQIQTGVYGHPLPPDSGRDPQAFVYPAYLVFFLGPFTLLPWPVVYNGAALCGPAVLAAFAWVSLRLCGCRFSPLASVAAILLVITSWPAVWSCYSRQPSLVVAAALVFSLFLYSRGANSAPALLLALATIKPHLMLLLAAWLLLHAITHRRYRFVVIFTLATLLLVAASLALLPHWISDWIRASVDYSRHSGKHSLLIALAGHGLGLALDLSLCAALAVRLRNPHAIRADSTRFVWAASLLLAATDCLIPANPWLVYNNLLLLPGILLLLRERPAVRVPAILRAAAGLCVVLALLITPLCAALGLLLGFSIPLVLSPFLIHFILPLPVTAALLALPAPADDRSTGGVRVPA